MKVLILANNDTGLLSFRQEVVAALLNNGYGVTVSLPKGNRIDEIKALGCKVDIAKISRRGMNPAEDLKLLRYYLRLLKREKPDVVLTYTIKPNIYGGWACESKEFRI